MKQIPSNIKVLYDAHLKNKAISKSAHFHYQKWLRYHLDFCDKYHLKQLKKENVVHFIKKLKEKKQTDQQQKQAYHAISLFYELVVEPINSDKVALLKNIDEKLATNKDSLNPNYTVKKLSPRNNNKINISFLTILNFPNSLDFLFPPF